MPLASRSSTRRCCSAAVPSAGILKSTSMSGISLAAFSVPLRAMTQKSEALLVTKASLCFAPAPLLLLLLLLLLVFVGEGWHPIKTKLKNSVQTKAETKPVDFSRRIGFLGGWFLVVRNMFTTKKARHKALLNWPYSCDIYHLSFCRPSGTNLSFPPFL